MRQPLTISHPTDTGWIAITDGGVRVVVPGEASEARLRPGQRVWAEMSDGIVVRAWIGTARDVTIG